MRPILGRTTGCTPNVEVLERRPFRTLYAFVVSRGGGVGQVGNVIRHLYRGLNAQLSSKRFTFPAIRALTGLSPSSLTPLETKFHGHCVVSTTRGITGNRIGLSDYFALNCRSTETRLVGVANINGGITSYALLFNVREVRTFPVSI